MLDAGCGPGVYAEWLLDRGATVQAIDASPRMVEHARQRTRGRAVVRVADLAQPLDFLAEGSIDLVLSAHALEYVRDWRPTFAEFHRVLVPGGHLVASVTHPFFDYTYFRGSRYFETEPVSAEWSGFGVRVRMPTYRRSLAETLNPFADAGFAITRILEPKPTAAFRAADPKHYEELMREPAFLCIQAVRR